MALAGCIGLYFGIETGSKRMQRIADKRLKLDGVDRILDVAENFGIETTVSFITGYPEELAEDQDQTLDMLGRCFGRPQECCTPQLHILLPEPGTPLFAKHSKSLVYDGYVTKFNARLLSESDKHDVLAYPELYSTYYYYPAEMPRADYTFAVDAVDAFRKAGHEVLSYALRFFNHQFSTLIACFREWVRRECPSTPITSELALNFIRDGFGATHHLTSLFRFAFAISSRNGFDFQQQEIVAGERLDHQCAYRLSPQSCLFTDLHDCPRLLERMRALPNAEPLDSSEVGELSCYMTIVESGQSKHYRIDPGVESILGLFVTPQKLSHVVELLREIDPETPADEHLFDELINIGVLIPFLDNVPSKLVVNF
jgi:hypothetical protein